MARHSTTGLQPRKRRNRGLPPKPRTDFPLTPHAACYRVKKIHGRPHYFGRWRRQIDGKMVRIEGDGWDEAERLYDAQINDLAAGLPPKITGLDQLDNPGSDPWTADGTIRLKDICMNS